MPPRLLSPFITGGVLRRLVGGGCLVGSTAVVWAQAGGFASTSEARPTSPEWTLAAPRVQGVANAPAPARTLREAVLDLQMRPASRTPDAGPWQLTLQRYGRPWQPGMAPLPDALAVGVYLHTGGRTQLGWQSRPFGWNDNAAAPWNNAAPGRPAGAMALRSADPLADLRLGALAKFSLGQQTSVSLRPRKGGLRLYLQAQW